MKKKLLILFTLTTSLFIDTKAQSVSMEDIEASPMIFNSNPYQPIIYSDTCNEQSNKNIFYLGTVVETTPQAMCGISCHSGTMKIKLDSIDKYIFIVTPCGPSHFEQRKKVRVLATCLSKDRDIGCYKNIQNKIKPNGQAFLFCESLLYLD